MSSNVCIDEDSGQHGLHVTTGQCSYAKAFILGKRKDFAFLFIDKVGEKLHAS